MSGFNKLHIAACSLEITGGLTYTYFLDNLEVTPDFDVKEWEYSDGVAGQVIGDTRLFFSLSWGWFEAAMDAFVTGVWDQDSGSSAVTVTGEEPIGHMGLLKKFMDLHQVFLIPDADQPSDKFEVLLNFSEFKRIALVKKGTISRSVQIPLKTKKRLSSAELQFFNFI